MKKLLLVLAASAFAVSCNKLAENEFEIAGTVDPSFNGKSVYLEKTGGFMGSIPLDTVKVENGKFLFKDTISMPAFYFVSVEGKPGDKLRLIAEKGEIEIALDKDTLAKSKIGGTYNNEKLYEYAQEAMKMQKEQVKKDGAFRQKYQAEITQAMTTKDTAAFSKLNKLYLAENKNLKEKPLKFIKENPKAYISIFLLGELFSKRMITTEEAKKLYDSFADEVKKTKEGKELGDMIVKAGEPVTTDGAQTGNTSAEVGKTAPAFSAPSPEGKAISLKESMGKVTVIDFWASWCKPCRVENPNVVAMYNELHAKGLNIIGVSLDKDAAKWKEAIAADKLTWNHVSNLKFWEEPIAKQYGVTSIPATFVLDAKGNIIAKDLRGAALKAKVEELLK